MTRKWLIVGFTVLFGLGVGWVFLKNRLSSPQAKIQVAQTNISASVYIDGKQVSSTTPYAEYRKPGEVTIRLVPSSSGKPMAIWESKVTLAEGVTTIVRHDFGETSILSAGEVLSFEKTGGKKAELAVVSVPDAAEVRFDGKTHGFTPLPIANATSTGEHTLTISHPGYITREIPGLRTVPGYKLTAVVYLAQDPQFQAQTLGEQQEASQAATPVEEPKVIQVEIQDTGTGFLRVRAEASKSSAEVAQVIPGKQFTLIEEDKGGEWYKIEYEEGKQGWISAQYAKKVNT
ncbi:MAG: SH3 domain-containing protein [Candidatus Blackburnbacteria bacterium]|nr:SH3 domain-containing protein [Candidatus Blackburnbacteria bacterium]